MLVEVAVGAWAALHRSRKPKPRLNVLVHVNNLNINGVYASRRYDSGEAITVYVGHDIGAADGNEDDYKAYKTIERDAAPCGQIHMDAYIKVTVGVM